MKTITSESKKGRIWNLEHGKKWILEKEIQPERYVYHITSNDFDNQPLSLDNPNRLRDKIKKEGLTCKEHWAIFANNGLRKAQDLFPFCLNYYQPFRTPLPKVMKSHMTQFDFWRIDTHAFRGKWFIDPVMSYDIDIINKNSKRQNKTSYICTREPIPNWALKLYTFDKDGVDSIWDNKVIINEGSTNIIRLNWIDNLIEHNWNKKINTESLTIAA